MQEIAPIHHLIVEHPQSLRSYLVDHLGLDAGRADGLLSLGAIYVDGVRANSSSDVGRGCYVRAHVSPRRFDASSHDWRNRVLLETEDFVVIDKPAGIPVHATVDNAQENALTATSLALGVQLRITHRLDRPTSGVCVFAKRASFQSRFNRLLVDSRVKKTYHALCASAPPTGVLRHWLLPAERAPRTFVNDPVVGAAECELSVDEVVAFEGVFECAVSPVTGRTHQIRGQLAAVGSPLMGDMLYSGSITQQFDDEHIALHASAIAFSWLNVDHVVTSIPRWRRAL